MDQLHIFVIGSAVIAYICVGFGTFTQAYFNMTRFHADGAFGTSLGYGLLWPVTLLLKFGAWVGDT